MAAADQVSQGSGWAWPAVLVAGLALLFTIASFWWLNARRGRLVIYEPHTFAAVARPAAPDVLLRLPLVFYNTGAAPIVVQNLRVVLPHERHVLSQEQSPPLLWRATRRTIQPGSGDVEDLAAVFAVPGRSVKQLFVEFGGPFPGVVPQARDYVLRVEAKLGHKDAWVGLLTFTLRAWHIQSPDRFIAYRNSKEPCTPDEVEETQRAMDGLLGLSAREDPRSPDGA